MPDRVLSRRGVLRGSLVTAVGALDNRPPGGGAVLRDDDIALTRTSTGELHGFSAV
jgi:hypothetical protein